MTASDSPTILPVAITALTVALLAIRLGGEAIDRRRMARFLPRRVSRPNTPPRQPRKAL